MKFFYNIFILLSLIVSLACASNKLCNETSPYLLQHKNNPVNWYPWGEEALIKAKKENKLIFLSIGYSTCHWCHVMAEESFEDKKVAKLLNDNFISIKVDREQYPYIDKYYQKVYKILNNKSGGWPLTILLTSDMEPFFAGTYVPKHSGYGSIGLINLINSTKLVSYKRLKSIGKDVLQKIKNYDEFIAPKTKIDLTLMDKTVKEFSSYYDFKNNGFTKRPKFPQASSIDLLLKIYKITKNKKAYIMAINALDTMAKGGIYDQIEGAFYRYTVDEKYEIPHFEKMLYTNAELIQTYTLAYSITKKPLYKKIIKESISQIDKRFKTDNLYMSASNADSENFVGDKEEGFYFLYDYDDTVEYLQNHGVDKNIIDKILAYIGITQDGNFDSDFSNPHIADFKTPKGYKKVKKLLIDMRKNKIYPFMDNKINTAWNALYIRAKFKASIVNKDYIKEAEDSLNTLLENLYIDGKLYHQTISNHKPTQKALLEDYAFLSSCLFEAYQVTLNDNYLKLYEELIKNSMKLFYKNGKWRDSTDSFVTYADISESAYENPLAQNIINMLQYSTISSDFKTYTIAKKTLSNLAYPIMKHPSYYPTATLASIMLKIEPVFIKSNLKNLKSIDISTINYPFVYRYKLDSTKYLACKIGSCFAYDLDFSVVRDVIENF